MNDKLTIALLYLFLQFAAAAAPPRVAILGDSITYDGRWTTRVESALRSTPEFADAEIVNFGLSSETVSGLSEPNHAGGKFPRPCLFERLERILDAFKPTLILACYGMNDGIYLPLDDSRFKAYQDGVLKLESAARQHRATIVFITPSLFRADTPADDPQHYDALLDHYAAWLVGKREVGWKVVNTRPDLRRDLAAAKEKNPALVYSRDGIHPGDEGHRFIAGSVCEQLWPMLNLPGAPVFTEGAPLTILARRGELLKHAWLSKTRHIRPGIPEGLPLEEAGVLAAKLLDDYRAALCASATDYRKIYRIMPVGDSITEGGSTFSNWRYPLWEKLYTAGYLVEYVGSRKSPSRIGDLLHEGYGGKDSGFLAATVPANFQKTPADIVLLHAGHNHTVEEKPVPQIILDTQAMISAFRGTNPKVIVLLAQPITSSKLPKYSYIPDLHTALAELAAKLNSPSSPVIIVPQGDGFDPAKDTISDGVHPNATGAAKMTDQWFKALVKVMDKPPVSYQPEILPYKKTGKGDLTLHLFKPKTPSNTPRPAIIFFYGGGWKMGTPLQFYPECQHFAENGIVAISADYRTSFTHGTTAFEADSDGKSSIRWVRLHAKELGIDPHKIIAAGASAGGQIAAVAGTVQGLEEPSEDPAISSRPDALALFYPVIDNGPQGYGDAAVKARYQEISPLHHITPHSPPTILFLGTKDPLVPEATARDFQARMKDAGVRCELKLFEGAGHPIYDYRKGASPLRDEILRDMETFAGSLWN